MENTNGVLSMNGYVIMKLEADAFAEKEDIVQQFNSYMNQSAHAPSFVHEKEGYFRISCSGESDCSSAGIVEFGKFLQSSGYTLTGISGKGTEDGNPGAEISFTKGGSEAHVVVSTINVY